MLKFSTGITALIVLVWWILFYCIAPSEQLATTSVLFLIWLIVGSLISIYLPVYIDNNTEDTE